MLDIEERRRLREAKRLKHAVKQVGLSGPVAAPLTHVDDDARLVEFLSKNEDELLNFVAKVNKVYEEKLGRDAPFMTFVFVGVQSSGKSTIMERFMNAPLNIIQEGTGTRCPLDTTCIHDDSCTEPVCDLYGEELYESERGKQLTVNEIFASIVAHNKRLGDEDRFSTKPLRLHYRANNVQNMRFVDTPGIISNMSTGKDNREDIKSILRSEMSKENTKLCVLLEPKEFATNFIVDFCDDTFGASREWMEKTIFLMTKYDKQIEDSRTGSKANKFFKEFFDNKCFPYLTITPTLPKEDLPSDLLFEERRELLDSADSHENKRFCEWKEMHNQFREANIDEDLDTRVAGNLGFPIAKMKMREIMLRDTVRRIPEVIASLRSELERCRKELAILKEKERMTDPRELRLVVSGMLHAIEERLLAYLNGDLKSALDYPEKMQSLLDEISAEENSDWASKELNFYTDKEDNWRDKIAELEDLPKEVLADSRFLGGKQVQRAISFFIYTTLDSLPDPYELQRHVANTTGYMNGGLLHEAWERAMVQITTVLMRDVSHPGVNYVVKHIGSIFRRLADLAMEDVKTGDEMSASFKLIPTAVEKHIKAEFEEMLWQLMTVAAERTHCATEPMYSIINTNLPNFHRGEGDEDANSDLYRMEGTGKYVIVKSQKQETKSSLMDWVQSRVDALKAGAAYAKSFLKQEFRAKANQKKSFLPSERSSMITDEEVATILDSSFAYLMALQEQIVTVTEFQINYFLYEGFKAEVRKSFMQIGCEANWEELVEQDPQVREGIARLEDQMASLTESLREVQRLSQKM